MKDNIFKTIDWNFFGPNNHQKAINYDNSNPNRFLNLETRKKLRNKRNVFESKFSFEAIFTRFWNIYHEKIKRQAGLDFIND